MSTNLGAHQLVCIEASRHIEGRDIDAIVRFAQYRIITNNLSPTSIQNGSLAFSFQSIAIYNKSYQLPFTLNFDPKITRCELEIENFEGLPPVYRNPVLVKVEGFKVVDYHNRILNCISQAHKQLPSGAPGILHIEIPYRDGTRFLDITDTEFNRIFWELKNRPKINAVILSCKYTNKSKQSGRSPFVHFNVVIPNPSPENPLPTDFSLPFSDASNPNGVKDKKNWTMVMDLGLTKPIKDMEGEYLYKYCHPHGAPQVSVWQSFHGVFRIDIVNSLFGRHTFSANINKAAIDNRLKIAFGNNDDDGVICAVNGKSLSNDFYGK